MITEDPYFLIWLLVTTFLYWTLPKIYSNTILVLSCMLYLMLHNFWSLIALFIVYSIVILSFLDNKKSNNILVTIFVLFSLLVIYRIYFISDSSEGLVLLMGFSFYILKAIHFLIDCYLDKISNPKRKDILLWLWFFPTLQIGPINRFKPFLIDLENKKWNPTLVSKGFERVILGYFKVIVLANYLISIKGNNLINEIQPNSWLYHYIDSAHYGLNLYVTFSGYSDVAIGFALMLGFRIEENFNFPFLATSIVNFWQRWHISLSSWCREYIYIPVFSSTRHAATASLTTMVFIGFWHSLSLTYLFWGVWHGVGIILCQKWQRTRLSYRLNNGLFVFIWKPLAILLTLNFVILSFAITSSATFSEAVNRLSIIFGVF